MNKRGLIIIVCCSVVVMWLKAQQQKQFRVIWYNVENLFDCDNDSTTNDDEFTPTGARYWTPKKYKAKLNKISKVITAIGEWQKPSLIGMCEVENDRCLRDLTKYSVLSRMKYKYLHHESPDPRGIDVALLYDPQVFIPISDVALKIKFTGKHGGRTRDILYVKGRVIGSDTIHVFCCHFPSRLGGEQESEPKRMLVASVLRATIDSIQAQNSYAKIIIMGDFNDFPSNRSVREVLKAEVNVRYNKPTTTLCNLFASYEQKGKGTNKYRCEWGVLDQMIVTQNLLLQNGTGLKTTISSSHIFEAEFLLEDDDKYLGKQPFRTYNGRKYLDGYSDHLPIFTDFYY